MNIKIKYAVDFKFKVVHQIIKRKKSRFLPLKTMSNFVSSDIFLKKFSLFSTFKIQGFLLIISH